MGSAYVHPPSNMRGTWEDVSHIECYYYLGYQRYMRYQASSQRGRLLEGESREKLQLCKMLYVALTVSFLLPRRSSSRFNNGVHSPPGQL